MKVSEEIRKFFWIVFFSNSRQYSVLAKSKEINRSQSVCVYSSLLSNLLHKWSYVMRTYICHVWTFVVQLKLVLTWFFMVIMFFFFCERTITFNVILSFLFLTITLARLKSKDIYDQLVLKMQMQKILFGLVLINVLIGIRKEVLPAWNSCLVHSIVVWYYLKNIVHVKSLNYLPEV